MIRFLQKSLALCLFVLLVFSCTKETIQPQETKSNEDVFSTQDFQYCFDNPNNPHENIGIQHNEGLDAIAASPDFGNLSIAQAHAIAYATVAANMDAADGDPVTYEMIQPAYDLTGSADPLVEVGAYLLNEGDISPEAYERILQLNALLDDSPDPQVFGEGVLAMEDEIMNNPNFTDFEREVLLGGTSIARHSVCYWITASMDVNSPWYPLINANSAVGNASDRGFWDKIKKAFKKVVKFVKKDIAGYKYAKKVINVVIPWLGIKYKIVVSVVVGVIYSWLF